MHETRSFSGSLIALGVTVGAHAAVVAALLAFEPSRAAIREITPMLVRMIAPEPVKVEPPKPEPPKVVPAPRPKPVPQVKQAPPPPLPVLAIPESTPAPASVEVPPQPAPVVLPPIETPPAPVVAAPQPIAVAPPPPPAPIEPPRFDADYLSNPPPAYPAGSRRLGEEGKVLVRVLVGEGGQPMKVELRHSSGFERLDRAALAAVQQWRFVPAKQGDRAVVAWVIVPLVFRLGS